jgi:hypothetical protein
VFIACSMKECKDWCQVLLDMLHVSS